MPKVNDIAKSTAHSQHAEMQVLVGARQLDATNANVALDEARAALKVAQGELDAEKAAHAETLDALQAALDAEKAAHAETQAALDAATANQQPQQ